MPGRFQFIGQFLSPIRIAAFDYLGFQARHRLADRAGQYCFLLDNP
jgi:hypothetical protein